MVKFALFEHYTARGKTIRVREYHVQLVVCLHLMEALKRPCDPTEKAAKLASEILRNLSFGTPPPAAPSTTQWSNTDYDTTRDLAQVEHAFSARWTQLLLVPCSDVSMDDFLLSTKHRVAPNKRVIVCKKDSFGVIFNTLACPFTCGSTYAARALRTGEGVIKGMQRLVSDMCSSRAHHSLTFVGDRGYGCQQLLSACVEHDAHCLMLVTTGCACTRSSHHQQPNRFVIMRCHWTDRAQSVACIPLICRVIWPLTKLC